MKKEEQIRMLLHPEQYTDEQLDQMLDEVEVPVPDAGEAWRAFRNGDKETAGNRGSFYPVRKIAAMFIGVLMLSGIAYAAYHVATAQQGNHPRPLSRRRSGASACRLLRRQLPGRSLRQPPSSTRIPSWQPFWAMLPLTIR
jgi:hypothetical protein